MLANLIVTGFLTSPYLQFQLKSVVSKPKPVSPTLPHRNGGVPKLLFQLHFKRPHSFEGFGIESKFDVAGIHDCLIRYSA